MNAPTDPEHALLAHILEGYRTQKKVDLIAKLFP